MKALKGFLNDAFCRYLIYWHEFGAIGQDFFYRCQKCSGLVTWRMINKGGCNCSGMTKIFPTNPKLLEWVRLLFMPWSVR